jgi:hypothetical protein
MKKRVFTLDDHRVFALCSGDHNPLHVDDISARRLLFGSPVTHGIHQVLWALDCWLHENDVGPIDLNHIRSLFYRPVMAGESVELQILKLAENRVRFSIFSAGELATKVDLGFSISGSVDVLPVDTGLPPIDIPNDLSLDAIEGRKGKLALFISQEKTGAMFPMLRNRVPSLQLAALLATTRLVGSECPGLHSVYAELNLQQTGGISRECLDYSVRKVDRRIGMITLDVTASDLEGNIKVFFRPPLCAQPAFSDVKQYVSKGEFAGQRAVIIGGSRGLGEVVAKLLSAGGAEVRLTYANGKADALQVIEQINSEGQSSQAFHFNALSILTPEEISSNLADWSPTHLYYFATPHISTGKLGGFSIDLFNRFCNYYVHGFLETIKAFKHTGIKRVFNPSSVMVTEIPKNLVEYAAAKSASETAGWGYQSCHPELILYQPRLPRMMTDQTVQLTPVTSLDPTPVMLEHLRSFNACPKK